jgi:hypothetical protein
MCTWIETSKLINFLIKREVYLRIRFWHVPPNPCSALELPEVHSSFGLSGEGDSSGLINYLDFLWFGFICFSIRI